MVRASREDPGVSSVVGTVLMLGITIAVFAGFSLVVLDQFEGSGDRLRSDLGVVQEGDRYVLQHRGGDPVPLDEATLRFAVDGAPTELPLAELAGQTADGSLWHVGESLCLSGPQPPCEYDGSQITSLLVIHRNAVLFSDAGGSVAVPGITVTYLSGGSATAGTLTGLAGAQSASDAGAEATLAEGATNVPGGTATATFSGTAVASSSATNPSHALAGQLSGDTSDQRAVLDADDDYVQVSGFTLPASANGVSAVTIGFEGRKQSSGGSDPQVRLSYSVGGVTGATTATATLATTTDGHVTATVTADRAWTVAALASLAVRVEVTNNPSRDAGIDHVYATVQYSTAPTTVYALDARLDFASVPAASGHQVQLRYRTTGDTFTVQVWDGSTYTTRGGTLSSTSAAVWTYTLAAAEWNGGAPRLRIVDADPAGTTQGTVAIAYARVVSTP